MADTRALQELGLHKKYGPRTSIYNLVTIVYKSDVCMIKYSLFRSGSRVKRNRHI